MTAAPYCNCSPVQFINASSLSSLGISADDIMENIRIIEVHRLFVYTLGKLIYPEYNFLDHDLSKFTEIELIPYTKKFILNTPDEENEGWKEALQHHYSHNPHHPQYWGDKSMPERYLKESIVDMIAAKYQYRAQKEVLPDYITLDMLDLQPFYLTRYTDSDRQILLAELERLRQIDWSKYPVPKTPYARQHH